MENSEATFQSEEIGSSKLPEYCKSIQYTDAHGQVKELILPRNLDVDRPKRDRTVFNKSQLDYLEDEFSRRQYLDRRERGVLAEKLRLTEAQVKVWFQNRRTKLKKISIPNLAFASSPSITAAFSPTYEPHTFDKQETSVNKSLSNRQINEFWQPFKSESSFKTNFTSSLPSDRLFNKKIRHDNDPSIFKSFEHFGKFHSTFVGHPSSTEAMKVETKVYQDFSDEGQLPKLPQLQQLPQLSQLSQLHQLPQILQLHQLPQRSSSIMSQQKHFSFETPDADK